MPATVFKLLSKAGIAYEIHPCIEPGNRFTAQLWRAEIRRALQQMSPQSRWQRFACGASELSERQLDLLVDIDGVDRVAWCAAIVARDTIEGLGVSRYVRLQAPENDLAEFALTVIDAYQRQGIGRHLLEALLLSAHTNGIRTLRGYVLPSNRAMLGLCEQMQAAVHCADGCFSVDITVPAP